MRIREIKRFKELRTIPKKETLGKFGSAPFYGFTIVAIVFLVIAFARPQIETTKTFAAKNVPVDLIIVKDGSASQLVRDVAPDRWQRSMRFTRVLASRLRWKGDRVAFVIFAEKVSPQVRLTTDVNVLLFALDHIDKAPPFSLSEEDIWTTNIAGGIRWAVKLVDKDKKLYGKSGNPQGMVVISDGLAWDGDASRAIQDARDRHIPIYVVGVGTTRGGYIPDSGKYSPDHVPIESQADTGLDRTSLKRIAEAGGGQYFEIGKESDDNIADQIISSLKRGGMRHATADMEEHYEDIYWFFLLAAGICFVAGLLTLI